MGAQHNKKRYGEVWPTYRVELGLKILEQIKPWAIVSGGWAWHFMSEMNHKEYKHAHDHKDIDLFIEPCNVAEVMRVLLREGFEKVWTRYDHLPSQENFRRYEKIEVIENERQVRITIDFFEAKSLKTIVIDGWRVVEPKTLLGFYSNIHSSDKCWVVMAAVKLIEQGKNPVNHSLLSKNPIG